MFFIKKYLKKILGKNAEDPYSKTNNQLLANCINFADKTIDKIMIHRSNINAIQFDPEFEKIAKDIGNKRCDRVLIYKDTLDNILGFVNVKDLLRAILLKTTNNIYDLIKQPIITTASVKLIDLLGQMQKTCTYLAIVVDEYGGTDGMVTIETITEDLIGPINDEYLELYKEENHYTLINKDVVIASARVKVETIESVLGIVLKGEEDEFDSIGGLILSKASYFPKIDEIIQIHDNLKAQIIDSSEYSIKKVKLIADRLYEDIS